MAQFIYTMHKVRKAVADKLILDDVTLSFLPGAKIGVVGPEWCRQVDSSSDHGRSRPAVERGRAAVAGVFGRALEQEPLLDETKTVRENVEDAVADLRATMARFEEVSVAMGEPDADFDALLTEQGNLMEKIEHANGWELDSRIEQAMDALRCPPGDEPVTYLSGGERRRVALCRLLLEQPDLLLLDEPTNHLDAESVQWLEQHLAKYPGTILAVTHDRYFLDNVAEWILELDRGRAYPYEGNYSTYLEKKAERLEVSGASATRNSKNGYATSWTGYARTPGAGKPRAKLDFSDTRRWPPRRRRPANLTSKRFKSRPVRASAASLSMSAIWTRASRAGC